VLWRARSTLHTVPVEGLDRSASDGNAGQGGHPMMTLQHEMRLMDQFGMCGGQAAREGTDWRYGTHFGTTSLKTGPNEQVASTNSPRDSGFGDLYV